MFTEQFKVKFVPAVLVIVPEGEIITEPISTEVIEQLDINSSYTVTMT